MIAGLESITSGQISIAGRVVNDLEPHARGCAMVFQNYALYPHMTVAENIGYALKVAGLPKAERAAKVAAVAASVGLTEFLDRRPGQLSGGQRQRVAMARAIVREPAVFLFDEPLSNLDAKLRVQMRHEIRRIHNHIHATSVFVTHDQAEGMTLADRLVVMNKGVIEQVGTPEEIYHHPASVYVGGFIGSPAMNFLSGEVSGKAAGVLLPGGAKIVLPGNLAAAHDGQLVQIGLRPEALKLVPAGKGAFDAVFDFAEELGPARLYHFGFEDLLLSVLSADKPATVAGKALGIKVDPNSVHLFAADTGKRLALREPAPRMVEALA
jgi:sn-glycerol 3-phosphate transport system ATP-binding protein